MHKDSDRAPDAAVSYFAWHDSHGTQHLSKDKTLPQR